MDRYLTKTNCNECDGRSNCFVQKAKDTEEFYNLQKNQISYKKGEIIIKEGTRVTDILYVIDGLIKVYIEGPEKNIIIELLKSNDFIGLTSLFGDDISEEAIVLYSKEKEMIYRELYSPFIKPVKGLPEFLHYASALGIPIALATSAPHENVLFTLEATGLRHYFTAITDSSMVSLGKPDPQVYVLTAKKLDVKPNECIVFEDSVAGIKAALGAGMRVIGVATTHNTDELLLYVDECITSFNEAAKLLNI